ncbi:MAG: hypothetical protein B6U88_01115 [Candidatus Aenigmarchaeota archaeon ex4484_56]|nr:MAG: hypothetical protein B6U88_01115 [Candidatus Aenigmarchaeota archaeon ex4484_56]
MCGILGYIGYKDALQILQEGLKKLTYRGYDSWGFGLKTEEKIEVIKDVGDFEKSENLPKIKSNLGISHTRWSTHGRVSKENAHPHTTEDGLIAVVHNGIIENFQELKNELISKGHRFKSETDTEIICHLIEEYMKKYDFSEAVRRSFLRLRGRNALVAICEKDNKLVGVKNGSPLMVGIGCNSGEKYEYFISSDIRAFSHITDKVIFLEDNELIVLN